jgi:hypothetical protein
MKGYAVASILMLLGVLLLGGGASAQTPPSGPSVVQGRRDLRFNTVIAGFPTTVTWDSTQAGQWRIRGRRGAEVQLDFVNLPVSLQNGVYEMPVVFAMTDAAWRSPGGSGTVVFDPAVGATARFGRSGQIIIYIGGTARPPFNQQPGDYVADIDIDVYYTGN